MWHTIITWIETLDPLYLLIFFLAIAIVSLVMLAALKTKELGVGGVE